MNMYAYVGNDPIIATDPSGLCETNPYQPTIVDGLETVIVTPCDDGLKHYRISKLFNGGGGGGGGGNSGGIGDLKAARDDAKEKKEKDPCPDSKGSGISKFSGLVMGIMSGIDALNASEAKNLVTRGRHVAQQATKVGAFSRVIARGSTVLAAITGVVEVANVAFASDFNSNAIGREVFAQGAVVSGSWAATVGTALAVNVVARSKNPLQVAINSSVGGFVGGVAFSVSPFPDLIADGARDKWDNVSSECR